ncbi:MAG: hypothetical protein ACM3OC_01445 [Deltaproteobacteria bacterium]
MHKKCLKMKFFHMIRDVLENHEALGLSMADKKKFLNLKVNTKKSMIQNMCESKLIVVDMMARLWENPISLTEVNKLIDKKYDIKKKNMKMLVQAFASFKKMLNEEQMHKLKRICREQRHEEESACCR